MKAKFSPYLNGIANQLKQLIEILNQHYDYVSILSTDNVGFRIVVSKRVKSIGHSTLQTERGNVIRVYKDGLYSEYAFNDLDLNDIKEVAKKIITTLDKQLELIQLTNSNIYTTDQLDDEPCTLFVEKDVEIMPEDVDLDALIQQFTKISDEVIEKNHNLIDCQVVGQSTHVSKMFLTANKDMRQSYVNSEGSVAPIGVKNGDTQFTHSSVSGLGGAEIFAGFSASATEASKVIDELLDADRIEPGVYEVITSPEVTGLIAHEAFGHGVEMDMFVKDRALGKEYIEKRVGSDLVTMHEGADSCVQVASYAFDDEGTLASDTIEIQNGILKTGVCDALSALRLGIKPTGNGKRENFAHKVYTRMTNTIFENGDSTVDEMIASIKYGYLLAGMQSGMEDPKHWGIQCIIERGYEIKDGKLTGKVVAPVVMTGYVPDLLGSISMLSKDYEYFGSGACGKGHKEWVKVSDGGPYMKAKAVLG